MGGGDAVVEVADLRKVYVSRRGFFHRRRVELPALDGIDLQIARGELFGLLGPNGAGKTTTTKILTTLLLPTSGTARVLGMDVTTRMRDLRRRIGFVFGGERGLYWRLSGLDNLRYFADLYGLDPAVSRRRIRDLLELLGLLGREHDRVEQYSRGMKQRLHLARGLLNDPDVLFLDEPTIGLDPVGARDLRVLIRMLVDQGKTIFVTTHYMYEADEICDRVAVIKAGRIVAEGTPASMKRSISDQGVLELELDSLPGGSVGRLRALDGVTSVVTEDRESSHLVTVHCARPWELMTRLGTALEGLTIRAASVREPTLEDAYIRLVSD